MLSLANQAENRMSDVNNIRVIETRRNAAGRQISAVSGYIRFPSLDKEVHFESSVERDFLLACRLDKQIVNITAQPFTIEYTAKNFQKSKFYTPDYLIEKNFEILPGQFLIGSHSKRYTLFEIKREEDLQRKKELSSLKLAAAYKWANKSADRAFSLMTDVELLGDFGKYLRLLSNMKLQPYDQTCSAVEKIFLNARNPTRLDSVIAKLEAGGFPKNNIHNAIWILVSHSVLQPDQLAELKASDILAFDHRHAPHYNE